MDAQLVRVDARHVRVDADIVSVDAGHVSVDADIVSVDADIVSVDAGYVSVDANHVRVDAHLVSGDAKTAPNGVNPWGHRGGQVPEQRELPEQAPPGSRRCLRQSGTAWSLYSRRPLAALSHQRVVATKCRRLETRLTPFRRTPPGGTALPLHGERWHPHGGRGVCDASPIAWTHDGAPHRTPGRPF